MVALVGNNKNILFASDHKLCFIINTITWLLGNLKGCIALHTTQETGQLIDFKHCLIKLSMLIASIKLTSRTPKYCHQQLNGPTMQHAYQYTRFLEVHPKAKNTL